MNASDPALARFYIGWDVGGWNCDRNRHSRDAIVILDHETRIVGISWRGNLRDTINSSSSVEVFLCKLFDLSKASKPTNAARVTLAVDAPLGLPQQLIQLAIRVLTVGSVGASASNPYLFRRTERFLFERGLSPLSAIKDMIGSQTTKGMHVLSKFAPCIERSGVWHSRDGRLLTALETYPAGCKRSKLLSMLRARVGGQLGDHVDEQDALICALIAHLFVNRQHKLEPPEACAPDGEGWIWLPKDALQGAKR